MSRLETDHRTVSWIETRKVIVGYHNCDVCGSETPEPTTEQMIEFAKSNRGCFMWPDAHEAGCQAVGWTNDYDYGLLCPKYTEVKRTALAERKKTRG
jgi:hypothetical protein